MKYKACRAKNWGGGNLFPIGEMGYCVVFFDDTEVLSIKWFPDELFYDVFHGELAGVF